MNPPSEDRNRAADRYDTLAQVVLVVALLIGCWLVLRPFIVTIIFATVIAASTWPAFRWLRGRLGNRSGYAALIACVIVTLTLAMPVALAFNSAADGLQWALGLIHGRISAGPIGAPAWFAQIPVVGDQLTEYWNRLASSREELVAVVRNFVGPAREFGLKAVAALGSGLVQILLAIFVLFFLYRDGSKLAIDFRHGGERIFGDLGHELILTAQQTVFAVVLGMVGTALAQALVAAVGFLIAGVPGPLLLSSLVFLLSMVPVGPPLVWGGAAIWLYNAGQPGWAIFMALYGLLVISSVDNFIKPFLIARTSQLSLLVAVLGVFGGVLAFGLVGLFIGPTLLALAINLVRRWLELRASTAAEEST
jgi:predicted PurR-regulated permease PerM